MHVLAGDFRLNYSHKYLLMNVQKGCERMEIDINLIIIKK